MLAELESKFPVLPEDVSVMGRKCRAALGRGYLPQYITVWRRRNAGNKTLSGGKLVTVDDLGAPSGYRKTYGW